jgi:hypothetical protein
MKPVDTVATILGVLAAVSLAAIVVTAGNYLQGAEAAGSVSLELSELELREGNGAEVSLSLDVVNESPLAVELETLHFSLHLNGNFVASDYQGFEKVTLEGFNKKTLGFDISLQPFYLRYIEEAREGEGFAWSLRGRVKLLLPFRQKGVWLDIVDEWKGV